MQFGLKDSRGTKILAVLLIICMVSQLILGNGMLVGWAGEAGSSLHKTIRTTEEEIREALDSYDGKQYIQKELLPYSKVQQEEALKLLKEALGDAVLVRQESLGDNCSAIVAVRMDAEDVIGNVFLIGLNGNMDRPCEFSLEIETEGGLVVRRAVVTEYSALGNGPGAYVPAASPSDALEATPPDAEMATPSDAQEASPSDAGKTVLPAWELLPAFPAGEAGDGTDQAIPSATPSEALPQEEVSAPAASPSDADVSEASLSDGEEDGERFKEDPIPFKEQNAWVIEEEGIGGLLKESQKSQGVFCSFAAAVGILNGDDEAVSFTAGAASILVLEARNSLEDMSGLPIYFVNMFDPSLISDYYGDTGVEEEFDSVMVQFLTGNGTKSQLYEMRENGQGEYLLNIPDHISRDGESAPYTIVTFYTKAHGESGEGRWIGRYYHLVPTKEEGAEDAGLKKDVPDWIGPLTEVEFSPVFMDTLFYSRQKTAEEALQAASASDAETFTSYWGAHLTDNPETLDGEILYFDVAGLMGNTEADQQGDRGTEKSVTLSLWFDGEEHAVTQETETAGVFWYQWESEIDENTQQVLTVTDGNGEIKAFPFMRARSDERNLIYAGNLFEERKEQWEAHGLWDTYDPQYENQRFVFIDNTLAGLDKGRIYAVLWPYEENEEWDEDAPEAVKEAEAEFQKLVENQDAIVAKLEPADQIKDENFRSLVAGKEEQTENALGAKIGIPDNWRGQQLHIRFFQHYEDGRDITLADLQSKLTESAFWGKLESGETEGLVEKPDTGFPFMQLDEAAEISRIMILDETSDYPCFYPGRPHGALMHGVWDSVFAYNTIGDESENIPEGTFVQDDETYYVDSTIYNYYSEHQLTGHNEAPRVWNEEGNELIENVYPMRSTKEAAQDGNVGTYRTQGITVNQALKHYFIGDDNSYPVGGAALGPLFFSYGYGYMPEYRIKNTWAQNRYHDYFDNAENDKDKIIQKKLASKELDDDQFKLTSNDRSQVFATPYYDEAFLRGDNGKRTAVGKVYKNVAFPFKKDAEGYWSYDSSKEEDGLRMKWDSEKGLYFLDRGAENAVGLDYINNPVYQFFPFNDPSQDVVDKPYYDGTQNGREGTYDFTLLDDMMTMRMEIPFTLPEDKQVEMFGERGAQKQDIVFRFSGDDDVWVYVDDELVLDLGGMHNYGLCEINFTTGQVTYRMGLKELGNGTLPAGQKTNIPWSNNPEDWYYSKTEDAQEIKEINTSEPHTLKIFYMERGLFASNFKASFNFMANDSFNVENHLDTSAVDDAVENGSMLDRFLEAVKMIGSFKFSIENAVTSGETLDVKESDGYLTPGEVTEYNSSITADKVKKFLTDTETDVWLISSEGNGDKADTVYIRSWGELGPSAPVRDIDRKLVNIKPQNGGGVSWTTTGDNEDSYLRMEVYNSSNQSSDNGGALYVGLVDSSGNRLGGWASTLTYGEYSNGIVPGGWSTVRISRSKLIDTASKFENKRDFDWSNIQAVQVGYIDETTIGVRNLQIYQPPEELDASVFQVPDSKRSDYNSISADGVSSELSPAEGAWYTSENIDNTEENVNQPAIVEEDGSFSLGRNGRAVFTNKFRLGSYLSVRMDKLDPQVFTTVWSLKEGDETVPQSWLTDSEVSTSVIHHPVESVAGVPGRLPEDGRQENENKEPVVHFNYNEKTDNTILYRSYKEPNNSISGFNIGVRFDTTIDIASIVVEKELESGTANENKEYYFAVVYDDVAGMNLEQNLADPMIYEGFSLKAGESVKLDMPAGTRYQIYELTKPLGEIGTLESADDLYPYLSKELVEVKAGQGIEKGGKWTVKAGERTNHSSVRYVSEDYPAGGENLSSASGTAYTKDEKGAGESADGIQGFRFINGEIPKEGDGAAQVKKVNEKGNPLPGAVFSLYTEDGQFIATGTTGDDGTWTKDGLAYGKYYFVEIKAPDGYIPQENIRYEAEVTEETEDNPVEVQVANEKIVRPYGQARLTKVDSKDPTKTLAGAKFDLYKKVEGTEDQWEVARKNLLSDDEGVVTAEYLTEGTYYFQETKAPDGYKPVEDLLPEKVKSETFTVLTKDDDSDVLVTLEMENEAEDRAWIRVQKQVTVPYEDQEGYRDDAFIIRLRECDADGTLIEGGFQTDLVLKHDEWSGWIEVNPKDGTQYFKITEVKPMEYTLAGIEVKGGNTEEAWIQAGDILAVRTGAEAELIVKNVEEHKNYFHDTTWVTNTASKNKTGQWIFEQKAMLPDQASAEKRWRDSDGAEE